MQTNFLKHLIERIAGLGAVSIIEILDLKKDVNEFLIAKKMNMTINQVRNILYKLSAEGLVSFVRKKDKRKGWYIYFWTLNAPKCLAKIESDLILEIQKLKETLQLRETKRFYHCKTCNIELNEEKALEHDFSCEECAGLYELSDSTAFIKELTNKILRKERDLKNIRNELAILEEAENKKEIIKQKKTEKEEKKRKEKARKLKKKDSLKKPAKKINRKPFKKRK